MRSALSLLILALFAVLQNHAETYRVGPGEEYENIGDLPLDEHFQPGDSVIIYWRAEPYKEKWLIAGKGTSKNPIVFIGIDGPEGQKPVIDGNDALTCPKQNYWNEVRGIIKIGGSNIPESIESEHIIIENLDIGFGRTPNTFTGRDGQTEYVHNTAAVFIESGNKITIRNCNLHDCGNGLFVADASSDILVEYNHIFDNGNPGRYLEHNNYSSAKNIIFQFNHFGGLYEGCDGNNLKDRSAGCIIRYNWIEAGNRQLDLVDAGGQHLIDDPLYRSTFVYGNILVEHDGEGNSQIIHYGGDSGDESRYRKGTLFLYNNTIISTRSGNTTLIRLSSEAERCVALNNIIYGTAPANKFAVSNEEGIVELSYNCLRPGWVESHSSLNGMVYAENNINVEDPGFADFENWDLRLAEGSPCIDAGTNAIMTNEAYYPLYEYVPHTAFSERVQKGSMDIGAYGYEAPGFVESDAGISVSAFPNPFSSACIIETSGCKEIMIYDSLGELIVRLVAREFESEGLTSFFWIPEQNVSPGVYFARGEMKDKVFTKKIIYEGR